MNKTLRDSVSSPQKVEKASTKSRFENPVITFIPEEEDPNIMSYQYLEIVLKVHRDASGTAVNTIKKKFKKYEHGTHESLLLWRRDVQDVMERKPCKSRW